MTCYLLKAQVDYPCMKSIEDPVEQMLILLVKKTIV